MTCYALVSHKHTQAPFDLSCIDDKTVLAGRLLFGFIVRIIKSVDTLSMLYCKREVSTYDKDTGRIYDLY